MRFDLPQGIPNDVPRKRERESTATPRLEPTPIELRRERLTEQAQNPRRLNLPRPEPQERKRPELLRSRRNDIPHDRRAQRPRIPQQTIGLSLRAEELKLLADLGRFRVISMRDLAETIYGNRPSRLERDLAFLKQQGLVQIDSVQPRRDGHRGQSPRIEVVTLTRAGRDVARQTSGLPEDQKLYAGLVKPREVEHDSQIYRAYRKEAERIEGAGGSNLRIRLDFELKAWVQKAIYAEHKADPGRDMNEIKQQVAVRFDLPFVNDGIQIPDARIEYDLAPKADQDMDQGSRTGHADIEVLTAAYRPGHLRAKAQAGFHLYASSADRATLTAKVEGDHRLLDNILEL